MNNIIRKNIKLLNLVEEGISGRTILRIIESCNDHYVSDNDLRNELGLTPTYFKIKDAFSKIDYSYFSIHCLLYFEINCIIIDKLKEKFNTLEEISNNLDKLKQEHLQSRTETKLLEALGQLGLKNFSSLDNIILEEVIHKEPLPTDKLKEQILNTFSTVAMSEIDNAIDNLIKNKKIVLHYDGLIIRKNILHEYLNNSTDKKDKIVLNKLEGATLQEIGDKENVSRERIRQIIDYQIKKHPIFFNEEKYYRLLNLYNLSNKELQLFGYNDLLLAEYIKTKYKLKPTRDSLNYITDFNLQETELAKQLLKQNKLTIINGEIVSLKFIDVFKKYINTKSIYSFCITDIIDDYNNFLHENRIEYNELSFSHNEDDIFIKSRKLDSCECFLNCGDKTYFVYKVDSFSSHFIESLDDFFNSFYGYGSTMLFLENNKELCEKNNIKNERELFAVSKKMFQDKYKDKIDFIRNPVFETKGIDKSAFIENLILDMNLPCKVNDYLDYIHKVTGLKQETVNGNFTNIINQFKNSQGMLSLDNEVSDEQYNYVKSIINNKKCISYSLLFNKIEAKYGIEATKIINTNNLRKIDYIKTNTSIYSIEYSSRLEAVTAEIDLLNQYIISESELSKISNLDYFYKKTYDFSDTNILLKISENKFLNLRKRNQTKLLESLKNDIFESINQNLIYTIRDYLESISFKNLLELNTEYKDLLFSFDTEQMIKNIILTLHDIFYIETKNTIIFSKRELSTNVLIDEIITDEGSITLLDLKEQLFNKYNYEKNISNSELSDMGYYCPRSSEKVYISKEYYEKELEEYLNGNS